MTPLTQDLLQSMVQMAQTYERLEQAAEARGIFSAIHFALDQAGFPQGEERAALLGFDNAPLDDRDVAPWVEEADGDEERAMEEERDTERADEHYAPSEPY